MQARAARANRAAEEGAVKRFEGLLAAFQHEAIGYGVAGGVTGGSGIETAPLVAARRALVDYVRERMELPADLVARIERQIVRFEAEHDVRLSFGEAVRTLLDVALAGEEARDED